MPVCADAPAAGPSFSPRTVSPDDPLPFKRTMRLTARALLLLASASGLAAAPALAQQTGLVRIDPCTGKPALSADPGGAGRPAPGTATAAGSMPSAANPPAGSAVPGPGALGSAPPGTASGVSEPGTPSQAPAAAPPPSAVSSSGVTAGSPRPCPGTGVVANPEAARRNRQRLRLGRGFAREQPRLGPAASVSVPTGYGVDAGELFVGVAYQGRTRYTEEADAAVVAGVGFGTRQVLAAEVALTSYSTIRGTPLETGGVSVRLHRAVGSSTSVAVGWENALRWGGSDDDGSLYAVGTRMVPLRRDPARRFGLAVFSLGVGNGRFRLEEDDRDGNETVNVFGAVGVRVTEPLSVMADWTGQDLNLAASVIPIRRVPLVVTAGVADLTGLAGDGARFILSVGYGLSFRQPF
jgi:hypothetical protein